MAMEGHYADIWHRIALAEPDRPAVVTVGESTLSRAEFDEACARVAALLGELGLRRGDKVAILSHNRPEWLLAFAGAIRVGIVPVALNFRYRAREVAELLDDSDCAAVVFASSLSPVVAEAVALLGRPIALLQLRDTEAPLLPDALDFAAYAERAPLPYADPHDGEFFIYTGGTTGAPKAAMWGVRQMLAMQAYNAYLTAGLPVPETPEEAVAAATGGEAPGIVALALSPYMHGTALTTVINALLLGGTVVVLPTARFDAERAVRTIIDAGVTRVAVAGDAIALPLLEAAESLGVEALPELASVLSSGMRFSDATKARLHALAPRLVITDLLASTEGGAVALGITRSVAELPARFRLTPGTVVLDDRDAEVQGIPGAVGRIAFTGGMPKGYYGAPEKTAENFVEIRGKRHIIPGDLVRVEEEGCIELLGRGAAVVNTGGEKVYPSEVEEAIMRYPGVNDAVVFGQPDPRWGEVVAAAIAVDDPERFPVPELVARVGEEIAGYKKPRRVLVTRDLERSGSGKIDLARIRRRAETEGVAL
ncbi:AMP-binding protein [Leucobacter allii]|uniref:AMP-binding protein n=1 Tax=Leucobacter allii TaxID=2932247 RepID=A0ABY4FM52_9MICO|nr:AMP-binding protein [Leucobacter allii]UOQ57371.1 AMP-binding protein [Leucobacter allii]